MRTIYKTRVSIPTQFFPYYAIALIPFLVLLVIAVLGPGLFWPLFVIILPLFILSYHYHFFQYFNLRVYEDKQLEISSPFAVNPFSWWALHQTRPVPPVFLSRNRQGIVFWAQARAIESIQMGPREEKPLAPWERLFYENADQQKKHTFYREKGNTLCIRLNTNGEQENEHPIEVLVSPVEPHVLQDLAALHYPVK